MRTTRMILTLLALLAAGVLYTAPAAFAGNIQVSGKDGIGNYLADEKGMALYIFKKDTAGKSVCGAANGCIEKWPVFYVDKADIVSGISPGAFGTITRDDGKKQTTLRGMPLYYFIKDKEPGDTNGQGVNNVWYLAAP